MSASAPRSRPPSSCGRRSTTTMRRSRRTTASPTGSWPSLSLGKSWSPCPEPARGRERLSRGIAENILKVYRELKPTEPFASAAVEFTPEAKALYQEWDLRAYRRALGRVRQSRQAAPEGDDQPPKARGHSRGHERRKAGVCRGARSGGRVDRLLCGQRQRHRGHNGRPP